MAHNRFGRWTPLLGMAGGALGLIALVAVFAGEATGGENFMGSAWAVAAAWASTVASIAMVAALVGVFLVSARRLPQSAAVAFLVALTGATLTVAATATLALVVPTLVERLPDLVNNPPAAVPATTIVGGLLLAVGGIWLALSLSRVGLPSSARTFLIVGAVIAAAPLPSRFFLFSIALAVAAQRILPQGAGADAE